MNILILQPYRHDTPAALLETATTLCNALIASHPEHHFTVVREPGVASNFGPEKYAPHAAVRNALLARITPEHDYVLWIDVDLVDYPAGFVRQALALNPDGVTAPAIFLEGTRIFYDIGGFIEPGGKAVFPHSPYARQNGPVWELESVGCMYLAPAQIYRDGARYAPNGPVYGVEHWAALHDCGRRVICDTRMEATHAYLPKYGKAMN